MLSTNGMKLLWSTLCIRPSVTILVSTGSVILCTSTVKCAVLLLLDALLVVSVTRVRVDITSVLPRKVPGKSPNNSNSVVIVKELHFGSERHSLVQYVGEIWKKWTVSW